MNFMVRRLRPAVLLLAILALSASPVFAQGGATSASLGGLVVDAQGGVIPGAVAVICRTVVLIERYSFALTHSPANHVGFSRCYGVIYPVSTLEFILRNALHAGGSGRRHRWKGRSVSASGGASFSRRPGILFALDRFGRVPQLHASFAVVGRFLQEGER